MSTADDQGQTDGPPGAPPGDGAPAEQPGYGPRQEDEVSLLDILLVLARHKTIIVRTVLVFLVLGVTYALLADEVFTSRTQVVREAQPEGGGGLPGGLSGGALQGLGINLGGGGSGLTPAAFPDVLKSREVRLAVVRDTFRFPDTERPMTFVDYVNRPPGVLNRVLDYTLWLPWTLKGMVGSAVSGSPVPAGTTEAGELMIPSDEEDEALGTISGMVSASIKQETGLMTISVTAGGPKLAAALADSFLDHFKTRIREIRTKKVRKRLGFVETRFQEAERELEAVEEQLAQFLERNQNPTTATLQFRRDRLQRQVSFKEQLYSELQSQLTQTRLDLQRQQPVVTVVEQPVPPTNRSAPQRTFIVLLMTIVGGIFGVVAAFMKTYFKSVRGTASEKEKLEEIQSALTPPRWVRKKLFRLRFWRSRR
ncbi:LPS O-antigen subunit length determinant protein (WzzB/FepE family) [Salinibacter ruber]|uniref:Wzz/FepE/Etk N-terminal domain-containing protein n=1 Tax=Salinibacter ruber TaxID=146919 RepID=UPI00216A467E|nr:Wzz/FepE/Etk N-terminal domain-containing protein [Salinibacter ruber]MCS3939537.1 LPS O-antigen subunit length determinant protein (WzzB/FepE family) [Salinibacter ruber]